MVKVTANANRIAALEVQLAAANERAEAAERIAATEKAEYAACEEEFIRSEQRAEKAEREYEDMLARLRAAEANQCDADDCQALADVRAQCAAMREALEAVQWAVADIDDTSGLWLYRCIKCDGTDDGAGHAPDCPVGNALAATAGADLLARVRRLEAIEAELRARSDDMPELRVRDFVAALEAKP